MKTTFGLIPKKFGSTPDFEVYLKLCEAQGQERCFLSAGRGERLLLALCWLMLLPSVELLDVLLFDHRGGGDRCQALGAPAVEKHNGDNAADRETDPPPQRPEDGRSVVAAHTRVGVASVTRRRARVWRLGRNDRGAGRGGAGGLAGRLAGGCDRRASRRLGRIAGIHLAGVRVDGRRGPQVELVLEAVARIRNLRQEPVDLNPAIGVKQVLESPAPLVLEVDTLLRQLGLDDQIVFLSVFVWIVPAQGNRNDPAEIRLLVVAVRRVGNDVAVANGVDYEVDAEARLALEANGTADDDIVRVPARGGRGGRRALDRGCRRCGGARGGGIARLSNRRCRGQRCGCRGGRSRCGGGGRAGRGRVHDAAGERFLDGHWREIRPGHLDDRDDHFARSREAREIHPVAPHVWRNVERCDALTRGLLVVLGVGVDTGERANFANLHLVGHGNLRAGLAGAAIGEAAAAPVVCRAGRAIHAELVVHLELARVGERGVLPAELNVLAAGAGLDFYWLAVLGTHTIDLNVNRPFDRLVGVVNTFQPDIDPVRPADVCLVRAEAVAIDRHGSRADRPAVLSACCDWQQAQGYDRVDRGPPQRGVAVREVDFL